MTPEQIKKAGDLTAACNEIGQRATDEIRERFPGSNPITFFIVGIDDVLGMSSNYSRFPRGRVDGIGILQLVAELLKTIPVPPYSEQAKADAERN